MIDIAVDTGRPRQLNDTTGNLAIHSASNSNNLTNNAAVYRRRLANRQQIALNIAVYDAVYLNVATGFQIARNSQIGAEDRRKLKFIRRFFGLLVWACLRLSAL